MSDLIDPIEYRTIPQAIFSVTPRTVFDLSIRAEYTSIKDKISELGIRLGEAYSLSFGLKTGDDSLFLTTSPTSTQHKRLFAEPTSIDTDTILMANMCGVSRIRVRRKTARPGSSNRFEQPKILIRDTGGDLEGTFDDESSYVKDVIVISDQHRNAFRLKTSGF